MVISLSLMIIYLPSNLILEVGWFRVLHRVQGLGVGVLWFWVQVWVEDLMVEGLGLTGFRY